MQSRNVFTADKNFTICYVQYYFAAFVLKNGGSKYSFTECINT